MLWVPPRSHAPEIMDRRGNSREALRAALGDIGAVNRRLGGGRALLDALRPFLLGAPRDRPLHILDVGTGGADLALAMVRLARGLGRSVRVVAVDLDRHTAALAAAAATACGEVRILQADAFSLPFARGTFDIVTASMFLHHFDHERVVTLLRAFRRVSRGAVIVNDLRRHRFPWLFILIVAHLTRRHAMFRHDAPLSVLRGFTDEELSRAALEAGAKRARPRRRWPFRLALTLSAEEYAP